MVKCRKCGKKAYSDEFVLDPDYEMVVCISCVKAKKEKLKEITNTTRIIEEQKRTVRPKDYDAEDVYLEKVAIYKEKEKQNISTDPEGKIKCRKCGHPFKYNEALEKPKVCPYCGINVKFA